MADQASTSTKATLPWQGVHHLALATQDLEATVHFYTEVMGMVASAIEPPNPFHGRTCTIKPDSNAAFHLHFFEQADAQPVPPPPDMLQRLMFPRVGVHHISFGLPNAAAAHQLQAHLQHRGIATTGAMDQGDTYILLFHDNNDVLLEANWPKA